MNKLYRYAILLFALTAPFAGQVMGQGIGDPPPCWPPPCIPIDGGVSALFVAGLLLGGRKAIAMRRARRSAL